MAEITFDPELMQHIKTIYGDAELDGRTLKLIHNTWKVNPDWIRNAALQKMPRPTITNNKPMEQFNTPVLNNRTPGVAAPNPAQELALDDLSRFSSFNAAYAEAKKRGGQGFQFRWKATKANPSGLFVVLDAVSSKPNTSSSSITNSNNASEYLKRPEDVNVVDTKVNWNDFSFIPPTTNSFKLGQYRKSESKSKEQKGSASTINRETSSFTPELRDAYNRQFGNIYNALNVGYYQQGGTMNNQEELQKAFMAYLIQDAAAQGIQLQSEQDLQAYAQLLGEEGIQAKYQEFMQRMQGGTMARLGAKLEYYRKLKGVCPDGSKPTYFEKGGRMVHKCTACEKAQKGKKLNAVEEFRNRVEKNDTVHIKNPRTNKTEVRDLTGKHKQYKQLTNKEYSKLPISKKTDVDLKDQARKNACGAKMKKTK